MARVRLIALGYENYTGTLGKVRFTDGVSDEIPQHQADAIGAIMRSNLVEADGTTVIGPASPAARLVEAVTTRVGEPASIDAPANQLRLDAEPFYLKAITSAEYVLEAGDLGYLIDFAQATEVTVPAGLPDGFYCSMRQGGDDQISIGAETGVVVEEIDGNLKSEKRLAILHLAKFPDGSFQLTGRTAA